MEALDLEKHTFLNLINHQVDIDEVYVYSKNPHEEKYQLLFKKPKSLGSKHCNNPKAFTEYSNSVDDIYKNIEEYNPNKKRKMLTVFDDMIADMLLNKKTLANSNRIIYKR